MTGCTGGGARCGPNGSRSPVPGPGAGLRHPPEPAGDRLPGLDDEAGDPSSFRGPKRDTGAPTASAATTWPVASRTGAATEATSPSCSSGTSAQPDRSTRSSPARRSSGCRGAGIRGCARYSSRSAASR
ncbi:hypothetical protein Ae263Ps1_5798c [Pseudonocardia sp. Ae263_Ps1]|nr:hypothetical protein Ae150APs1_5527 [Pseudonocardia sp. Ae150A_Ps1]OLL88743.1 hypothetical protein Ae263Ps1_5798c [Pseudonocardia sp. Ae263_Ps1]OLL91237.1 hypothetical protein Ae356Ps1_1134 [Pseudonocardia sp. Ae356_Ps1]